VAGTRKPSGDAPSPAPRPSPRPRPPTPEPALEPVALEPVALEPVALEPVALEPAALDDDAATSVLPGVVKPEAEPAPAEPEPVVAEEAVVPDDLTQDIEEPVAPKPSPRPKLRDGGIRKPVSMETAEAEIAAAPFTDEEAANLPAKAKPRKSPYLLAAALIVVGLLLAGAAVIFKINANQISAATSNTALLDVAKTSQVKDQVSKAAETLFSYDFNDIAKTENAAKDLLVGDAVRGKYDKLMGEVKRLAPAQKMVVTSKVTRSGVIMLNGDLAKVMVFIDQTSTRADTKQSSAGSAQLHLNAELQNGTWKITDMDTYIAPTAPAAPPSPSPSVAPGK
jgi:Mce-associated membrane protein